MEALAIEWGAPTERRVEHAWVRHPETGRWRGLCAMAGPERWTEPLRTGASRCGVCRLRFDALGSDPEADVGALLVAAYPRAVAFSDLALRLPWIRVPDLFRLIVIPMIAADLVGTHHYGKYLRRYYARAELRV